MKRNTWWNRIFHPTTIKVNQTLANLNQQIVCLYPEFEKELSNCSDLYKLLDIHKRAWGAGFQNENIGPCSYGIFRTKDISEMKPEEVYLGGIYGLYTKPIPFWHEHREDKYGANGFGINEDLSLNEIICGQYRRHLISNLRAIKNKAQDDLIKFHKLNYKTINQVRS